jgi:hypothetical protein
MPATAATVGQATFEPEDDEPEDDEPDEDDPDEDEEEDELEVPAPAFSPDLAPAEEPESPDLPSEPDEPFADAAAVSEPLADDLVLTSGPLRLSVR